MLYCSLFKYDIHNDVLDTSYYCYSLHVAGMAHHLSMGAGEGPWGSAFSRSLGHYPSPYLPPHCGPPGLHPPNFPRMLALSAAAAEHSLHQPPRSKSESDTVIRDKITWLITKHIKSLNDIEYSVRKTPIFSSLYFLSTVHKVLTWQPIETTLANSCI